MAATNASRYPCEVTQTSSAAPARPSLEDAAKRFARRVVKPLIPDEAYARVVTLFYSLFGRKAQHEELAELLADRRLDPVLRDMMLALESMAATDGTSEYWRALNRKNVKQLLEQGFENFKQTVALNYFTWLLERNNNQEKFLKRRLPPEAIAEAKARATSVIHPLWSREDSKSFNVVTSLLWRYAVEEVGAETMGRLEEPRLGNPPALPLDGRLVSQDLANSALEYDSVRRAIEGAGGAELWSSIRRIVEIGAGYGRTAYVFQTLKPDARYVIGDIPPALYLSQRYLTEVFPALPAFKFRPFDDFALIERELAAARLGFVLPAQLEKFPDRSTDLFVAIDCLHEMVPKERQRYFDLVDRTARFFYFTCRKITAIGYDGLVVREQDYPVKAHWKQLLRRERRVRDDYFEALYEIAP